MPKKRGIPDGLSLLEGVQKPKPVRTGDYLDEVPGAYGPSIATASPGADAGAGTDTGRGQPSTRDGGGGE